MCARKTPSIHSHGVPKIQNIGYVALSVATLPGTARQGKCALHASAVRVSAALQRDFLVALLLQNDTSTRCQVLPFPSYNEI